MNGNAFGVEFLVSPLTAKNAITISYPQYYWFTKKYLTIYKNSSAYFRQISLFRKYSSVDNSDDS